MSGIFDGLVTSGSGGLSLETNLRSKAFAQFLDAIAEGEIEGLVDGDKSIYLDGVPLQASDGTYNFKDVIVQTTTGTNTQSYLPGFSDTAAAFNAVNTEVKAATPVVRTVSNSNVNAVAITLAIPQLTSQNTSTGAITGTSVEIAIDVQPSGGSYTTVIQDKITGKSNSQYEKSYRVALTGSAPWNIRMRRLTPDSTSLTLANKTVFGSYSELIDAKLRYPNTALVGIKFDAAQFSSIPTRAYDVKLLKIKVPTNYDPIARTYTGVWDGTFKTAWSDNPAWCFYDLLTNERYGLGAYFNASQVDKWALYTAGQYCDGTVPNGFGGYEPRFTCNLYISSRQTAYKVMQDLASVFRSMTYWQTGSVTVAQDSPKSPVYQFTPANVIGGMFNYVGSSAKARHTVALVTWNDPADAYNQKIEYVEDTDGISRYGIIQTEVVAVGCTSRGQANRVGRWLLYTEQMESEVVTFTTGLEGAIARPGQIIQIADPTRGGARRGGRIVSASGTSVTLDAAVEGDTTAGTLSIILPTGVVETRSVSAISGAVLTLTSAFSTTPTADTIYVFQSTNLQAQLFRVVSCKETEDGNVEINALAYNASKFDKVENGLILQTRTITNLNALPNPPTSVTMSESLYLYQAEVRAQVSIAWPSVSGVTGYRVMWQKDNTNFQTVDVSSNSYDILDITPGVYNARVYSLSLLGSPSANYTAATITALGKTAPPGNVTNLQRTIDRNIGITLTWDRVTDLDIDSYEVRQGSTWTNSTLLGQVKGTSFKVSLVEGAATTFLVKARDTSGVYSTTAASISVTIGTAVAPTVTASFAGENLVLNWNAVEGELTTEDYVIRYGTSFAAGTAVASVKGTTYSIKANWSGSRTFWVAAQDIAGTIGTAGSAAANVTVPASVTITQQVVDNNVLLQWTDATQTLPIDYYDIRKGSAWASATSIGRLSGRFSTIFESAGGGFNYWVAGVDSAGNSGTPVNVYVNVNPPPDYVLQMDVNSTFGGTKSNLVSNNTGGIIAPIPSTETWATHFTNRSWTTIQSQISAGYDMYIQPSATTGYYEETIDYGSVVSASKITSTLSYTVIGTVTITPTISVRATSTGAWTDYAGLSSVFAQNFRYVKVRYTFDQTGGTNLVNVTGLNIRLDVKLKNDAGVATVSASDTGGTTVNFTVGFTDVNSITVTPQGTTPLIAIYDFVDVPNPTSFKILLFNTSGVRQSGTVSWSAKGV